MNFGVKRSAIWFCVFTLLSFSLSCSFTKGKETAERAVIKFHNQLNAGQFHEIYAGADEGFRKASSEQDVIALFEAVRRKLGAVKSTKPTGWRVNATPMGTMVNLGYEVEFSEAKGMEEFVFHVSGDQALLFNYNVNSAALITR